MQFILSYASLYFSHSPAVCLSCFTYNSISLFAVVTCLPLCYRTDLYLSIRCCWFHF